MARDLFGHIGNSTITVGTKKWYTVPLSIAAHAAALLGLVITPLVASGLLPTPDSVMVFAVAPPTPPPPELPKPVVATSAPQVVSTTAAPVVAPHEFTPEPPQPASLVAAAARGTETFLQAGAVPAATVLAKPAAPTPEPPPFVRPGGQIKEPRKIHDVPPIYPAVARTARISGMVILEATISKDGDVREAVVMRSTPMLDQAALDAVRAWRFTPTTLNGIPVEVKMTVTVNFLLQ